MAYYYTPKWLDHVQLMLGLLSQKDLAEQLRQYFDRTVYSCQTYHTTWSSVDKKKIMSAFIGKAQEEYKEESQKTVS